MAEKYKVNRPAAKMTKDDIPSMKLPETLIKGDLPGKKPFQPGSMERPVGDMPDVAIPVAGAPESTGTKGMAGKTERMTLREMGKKLSAQGLGYLFDKILEAPKFKGKLDKVFLFKYDDEGKMQEATETEEAGMMVGGAVEEPGKAKGGPVDTEAEKKFQVTSKKLESDAGATTRLMDGKELNALKKHGPQVKAGTYDPNKVYNVHINPDTKEIVSVDEDSFAAGGGVNGPTGNVPGNEGTPEPPETPPVQAPPSEEPSREGEGGEDDMTGPFADFAKQGVDAELVAEGDRLFSALDEALSKNDEAGVQKYMDELKAFAGQVETKRSEAVKQQNDTKLAAAYKEMAASAKDLLDAFQGMLNEQGGSPEAMAESAFQKEKAQVKAA